MASGRAPFAIWRCPRAASPGRPSRQVSCVPGLVGRPTSRSEEALKLGYRLVTRMTSRATVCSGGRRPAKPTRSGRDHSPHSTVRRALRASAFSRNPGRLFEARGDDTPGARRVCVNATSGARIGRQHARRSVHPPPATGLIVATVGIRVSLKARARRQEVAAARDGRTLCGIPAVGRAIPRPANPRASSVMSDEPRRAPKRRSPLREEKHLMGANVPARRVLERGGGCARTGASLLPGTLELRSGGGLGDERPCHGGACASRVRGRGPRFAPTS
jgi:hypothetical protein